MEILSVKNLNFTYAGSKNPSLTDINFSADKGEWILLAGKSGCGKTTLLRHLKKVMRPLGNTSGDIIADDYKVGYVMQNPDNQIVTDKVWHELAFGLESLGMDTNTMRLRVAELVGYFGIEPLFHKETCSLSGGEKQVISLASVMAMHPEILVLDEPSSQLGSNEAASFFMLLKKLQKELGITIIMSEHRLESVYELCDRVVFMDKGKIIYNGSKHQTAKAICEHNEYAAALPVSVRLFNELMQECDVLPMNVNEGKVLFETYMKDRYDSKPADTNIDALAISDKYITAKKSGKDSILRMKNVWFRYEKNSVDVLRNLSIDIQRGSINCILGGNGAGKSTLLKVMTRALNPYEGKISANGKNIKKYTDNELYGKMFGILPQNPVNVFLKDNIREDLEFHCRTHGIDESKLYNLAKELDIDHLLEMHPYDISGGEQQRAALCKILLTSPEILALDEPTKGFDGYYKKKFANILLRLKEKGTTVIIISHDVEFCAEYGDYCSLLFDGGIAMTKCAKAFFAGNMFYTTEVNRIVRDYFPAAVTIKDVMDICGRTDIIT